MGQAVSAPAPRRYPLTHRPPHVVPADAPRQRLDRYAFSALERLATVSQARKAARRGDLLLNGETCESSRFVQPGDRIELLRVGRPPPRPFRLELQVLHDDDWLAVVDKPPGLPVSGNRHRTLENALPGNLEPSAAADALDWPRPVHRLDIRTGGLVVVAKAAASRATLGALFEERRVHKRYRALAVGRLEGEGTVDVPVEGRPAVTRYRALAHGRSLRSGWLTDVELEPATGRTHQLRRHLAHLGCPVLGDDLYGIEGQILRGHGLFLRALGLRLPHPDSGDELNLSLPEPAKFARQLAREQRRWERYLAAPPATDSGSSTSNP